MNYLSYCLLFCQDILFLTLGKLLFKDSDFIPNKLPLIVEFLKIIGRLHPKGGIFNALGNLPVSNI